MRKLLRVKTKITLVAGKKEIRVRGMKIGGIVVKPNVEGVGKVVNTVNQRGVAHKGVSPDVVQDVMKKYDGAFRELSKR